MSLPRYIHRTNKSRQYTQMIDQRIIPLLMLANRSQGMKHLDLKLKRNRDEI